MNEDILLVDDDRAIRQELGGYLEDLGYGVRVAASVAEYRKSVNERVPKLLLLDLKLTKDKEDEGLEILKEFLSENPLTTRRDDQRGCRHRKGLFGQSRKVHTTSSRSRPRSSTSC